MNFIKTERLRLMPLSNTDLLLLAESREKLEQSLGLEISDFRLNAPDSFQEEFNYLIRNVLIEKVSQHRDAFYWYTHWLIIEASTNTTVGGIGARGETDADGENMIGYFIDGKSESKGYATEAVRYFTKWMFKQDTNLKIILADTLVDGYASQKVLQKAGFVFDSETAEGLRWKLVR